MEMAKKKTDDFFSKLQKNIDVKVKGAHASVMSESEIATQRFSVMTPCYDLNRILSGSTRNGIKSRNLMGIIGPEHTMKSSFMVLCMVNAQKQGKKAIIIDTEGGCDNDFCLRWGLNTDDLFYIYTPWIDEVIPILAQIKETDQTDMVIGLDSVGGLQRLKAYEDALSGDPKQDQGLLQKDIKAMLKLYLNICIAQNSIGITTGHYYGNPNDKYEPEKIGGGKAMRLLPSILVTLQKHPLFEFPNNKGKERGTIIGNSIKANTIKNRGYPPFQQAEVMIDYTHGVLPFAGVLDLAIEADIVRQNGSWYSYGDERLAQGRINALKALEEVPEVLDKIDIWLENTGYSSHNEEVEKAEQMIEEEIEEEIVEVKKIRGKKKK
jgi:recombination protein RecA